MSNLQNSIDFIIESIEHELNGNDAYTLVEKGIIEEKTDHEINVSDITVFMEELTHYSLNDLGLLPIRPTLLDMTTAILYQEITLAVYQHFQGVDF